ncbi:MAG: serine/threonine-protein kinase [bacterium]
MKPFELPGYEIKDKLGEGGMATVWRARQISLDRPVAIKVLSKQSIPDADAMVRFRQEAQSAARINHQSIVQVYDAGEKDGLPYFVMEYIEGCSVGDLLERKGKLSEKNTLLIAEGVALGLGYAWEKAAMIHCDVKPDNIMVERDGSVKVADLGLARLVSPHAAADHSGLIIGTPNYTSPEQAEGVPDLDCRSDIYSLGAMLYHMVTGVLPFAGSVGSTAMDKHVSDHLPDPLDLNPEISQGLAWLIEKMMIKDRALRPQTWVSILYDMKEVRNGGFPTNLPGADQSTVLRSEKRLVAASPHEVHTAGRNTSDTSTSIRRKIVIPRDEFEQVRASSQHRAFDKDRALAALLVLGLLAFGAYQGVLWFAQRHQNPGPQARQNPDLPPRSAFALASTLLVSSVIAAPVPEAVNDMEAMDWEADTSIVEIAKAAEPEAPEPEPVPSPAAARKSTAIKAPEPERMPPPATTQEFQIVTWDNPAFVEGARLFNSALAAYDGYRKDRSTHSALKQAETDCRRALNLFNSCKALAPEKVNIQSLIAQCYQMLADIRHSLLLDTASGPSETAKPFMPAPEVVRSNVAPAAPATAPKELNWPTVSLSPLWNTKLSGSDLFRNEMYELLSPHGKAEVVLAGDPSTVLFGEITFLMPAKDAGKLLNKTLSLPRVIDCPGFPSRSFSYYTIDGIFEGGFNKFLLIVDTADRVVGVQLVNDRPEKLWLDPMVFTDSWHSHNFVEARAKGNKKWKIAYRVLFREKIMIIDSELITYDEKAMGQLGKPKEQVSLILPHQIVNLILYRIEKGR